MRSEPPPSHPPLLGLLGGPPPPEAIVGIDPSKALTLAGALGRVADRAGWVLAVTSGLLAEAGEDAGLLRPLQEFRAWCDVEQSAVRATAEAVLALEAGPPPTWLAALGVHHDPDLADFRSPIAAVDAAAAAVAALQSGDRDAFVSVAERWAVDGVFAAVLLDRVGSAAVAEAVSYLAALTGSGLDEERRRQERVVSGLAVALDAARRAEVTDISVGSLLDALDGRPAGELALLFVGPTVFDASFLADAVHRLIEEPAGPHGAAQTWVAAEPVDDERRPRDSTTLVLQAVSRDPAAATRVLLDADLDRLLVDASFPDEGAALARVLDLGTDPALGCPDAPRAALEVITWVADHTTLERGDLADRPQVAVRTWAGLGRVGEHYIGSFRSDGHDGVEIDPVSDQLRGQITGPQSDRFLMFAARQQPAAEGLRAALAAWAAVGVARIASRPMIDLAPYTVIGDVGRRVSDAVQMASFSWAGDLDDRRATERLAWSTAVTTVSAGLGIFVPVAAASVPAGYGISAGGGVLIEGLVPAGRAELDQARQSGRVLSGDQLRLEYAALAGLWSHRADNHLFDGLAPPPALLDGARLRAMVELDEAGVEQFRRWCEALAERLAGLGGSPLDRLGAEFGSTGARPTG